MTTRMGLMGATTDAILGDDVTIYDNDENPDRQIDNNIEITPNTPTNHNDVDKAMQTRVRRENVSNSEDEIEKFFVKYEGRTYEISEFFKKHPGGRQTLSYYKGLPLDEVLKKFPHSTAAFHLFEEFVVENRREYDDIENLVDWNSPLLSQVGHLADKYWEWVNLPVNRSIRLFKWDFLEYLTITPWYLVPMVWIPISLYFFYMGLATNNSNHVQNSIPEILIFVSWGLLLWTILEYALHRNLFHMKPPADNKTLITLHFLLHGLHHKAPFDDQRLVFPPAAAALVATIFYNLYKAVISDVMINFVAAGTMTGYICYDLMHYYLHHGSPKADSYLYVMKRYHNHHHFSHHNHGFGITNRLWDSVFGSLIKLKRLKKPIIW